MNHNKSIAKIAALLGLPLLLSLSACTHMNTNQDYSEYFNKYFDNIPVVSSSMPEYSYRMPSERTASGKNTFVFDPKHHMWGAYDKEGSLVRQGRASGGKSYCPDIKRSCLTPVGSFKVFRKDGPGCKSTKFPLPRGGAPMPNCMFFRGGYAIHGSSYVPNFNASHGCIRVTPMEARWLDNNFMKMGSSVVVQSYH